MHVTSEASIVGERLLARLIARATRYDSRTAMRATTGRLVIILIAACSLMLTDTAGAARYEIIDIGPGTIANEINDSGVVAGSGGNRAMLLDTSGNGGDIDLGALPGEYGGGGVYSRSSARGLSNNGQVVGVAWPDNDFGDRAVLFDPTGAGNNVRVHDWLGDNRSDARAYAVNDAGQIVGNVHNWRGPTYAALFDPTGATLPTNLGTLGGRSSSANDVNNAGQIVGWAHDSGDKAHASIFDSTGGGANIDLGRGAAFAINDLGQVVGAAGTGLYGRDAALFDTTGGAPLLLGNLGEQYPESRAAAINNGGQIVGYSSEWSGEYREYRACLFDATGGAPTST